MTQLAGASNEASKKDKIKITRKWQANQWNCQHWNGGNWIDAAMQRANHSSIGNLQIAAIDWMEPPKQDKNNIQLPNSIRQINFRKLIGNWMAIGWLAFIVSIALQFAIASFISTISLRHLRCAPCVICGIGWLCVCCHCIPPSIAFCWRNCMAGYAAAWLLFIHCFISFSFHSTIHCSQTNQIKEIPSFLLCFFNPAIHSMEWWIACASITAIYFWPASLLPPKIKLAGANQCKATNIKHKPFANSIFIFVFGCLPATKMNCSNVLLSFIVCLLSAKSK